MVKKELEINSEEQESEIIEGEVAEVVQEAEEESITPEQAALEEIKLLQKELAETQAKTNEYLDGWQRSRAEFANYKKRVERDQADTYQRAAGAVI